MFPGFALHTHNTSMHELGEVTELSPSSHRSIKALRRANTRNTAKLDALLWCPVRCLVRPTPGLSSGVYSDCKRVREHRG